MPTRGDRLVLSIRKFLGKIFALAACDGGADKRKPFGNTDGCSDAKYEALWACRRRYPLDKGVVRHGAFLPWMMQIAKQTAQGALRACVFFGPSEGSLRIVL